MFEYKVIICDNTGIIKEDNSFTKAERKVVAENDKLIVIDDIYFTRIEKVDRKLGYSLYPILNEPIISIYTNDSCWGNRLTYTLYTENGNVKPAKIRREIEKEIAKKFGFFVSNIDLSFIK